MKWFGPKPFSPACEPGDQVPTPTAVDCDHCGERIAEGDDGYMIPAARALGIDSIIAAWNDKEQRLDLAYVIQHYECHMVGIIGHVRCLLTHGRRGVCPNEVERDPPGMSKREAAKLSEHLWQQENAGLLTPQAMSIYMDRYFPSEARRN